MSSRSVEHAIPGEYQLRALREGWRLQRAWHRARLDLLECVLPPGGPGLVLDAASGSGIVTWRFRDPAIVSTDMRIPACEAVRAHSPGAKSVAAVLDALPFRSRTFSRVYLLEAIEHLDPAEGARALGELHRVSRPGARCLVTTPNYRSGWPLLERLLDRWGPTPPMGDAQHVAQYDRRRLASAARGAGWNVRRIGTFNLVGPLLGALSPGAGAWATRLEAAALRAGGPLLFALLQRDA